MCNNPNPTPTEPHSNRELPSNAISSPPCPSKDARHARSPTSIVPVQHICQSHHHHHHHHPVPQPPHLVLPHATPTHSLSDALPLRMHLRPALSLLSMLQQAMEHQTRRNPSHPRILAIPKHHHHLLHRRGPARDHTPATVVRHPRWPPHRAVHGIAGIARMVSDGTIDLRCFDCPRIKKQIVAVGLLSHNELFCHRHPHLATAGRRRPCPHPTATDDLDCRSTPHRFHVFSFHSSVGHQTHSHLQAMGIEESRAQLRHAAPRTRGPAATQSQKCRMVV